MTISVPLGKRREFTVREFYELGQDESASPFLTPFARKISQNLPLKASIFSAVLFAISFYASYHPELESLSKILLAAVYLIVGVPALIDSIEDIVLKKDVNIDVLMTVAAFSSIFIGSGFEGALLLVLFALSGAIEDAVSLKAKSALLTIHSLVPMKACVVVDDQILERAIYDIEVGSVILVRAGEIVPLDGIVVDGTAEASFAHLTGESTPIFKQTGDEVASGARLIDSSLLLKVTHKSADSTVSKIVALITNAQSAKPKLERTFDRFGRNYAISIMLFSLFVATAFPTLLGISYFGDEGSLYRALSFLITASPCALILAVPIAYLSSLGALARKGIVLKGGVVLDALNSCKIIAFDKTGTLTLGELTLDDAHAVDIPLLQIAGQLERNAVHPIAQAVMRACQEKALVLGQAQEVKVIPGYGVEGLCFINGVKSKSFIGGVEYVAKAVANGKELQDAANRSKAEGKIVAALMVENRGYLFTFSDKPRPKIARMVDSLKQKGYRLLMLTGDSKQNAERIAKEVGISEFEAELKPEDKLERIDTLAKTERLAMCGDGINDAPALARATVGISMGQVSSATARQAADVIFLHDTIQLLDTLFAKAEMTNKIVKQNLTIALIAIVCGSIPALYGILPLWLAVIVHEGGTVLVGLNALRLLK